ncbi:toxin-antitoxin system, toxin component, PIN family protein [Nocardia harenae]|uniref:PIN-like domain-containing protein n=1 Tax=Nocardia harenae TaxID=358707 RepID=UPI00082A70F6|nr:toxin-antitoxin system, toxin component, PIN family protein [Nocardia harenae]
MRKPKRSAAQPEFFIDRNLGKLVPEGLRALGWQVHLIAHHFADDAQGTADEEWIRYGLERGWIPLCKDGKIRSRPVERQPLIDYSAPLFYLESRQLKVSEMVERLHAARPRIHRAVAKGGPAAYAVGANGQVTKRWP